MSGGRLRVARVGYAYPWDAGSEEEVLDRFETLTGWCEGVVAAGVDMTVYQRFGRDSTLARNGVTYQFVADRHPPRLRTWHVPRRLEGWIAEGAYDVVHLDGLVFPIQTWALRRRLGVATALIVQHHGGLPPTGARAALRRWGTAAADGVLFAAESLAADWRAAGVLARDMPVFEVMEGSTHFTPRDRAEARRRTGLRGDPLFLWVGRLNANKDPLTVLEGLDAVFVDVPEARLYMAYSADDLLVDVERVIADSPALRERVTLLGRIPHEELADYYNAADYLVLGSHHEGSGYALIEALACGVVPIVTNIPTFRTITGNGRVGGLWRPDRPEELARATRQVMQRPLVEDAREARAQFERELSFEAIGKRAAAIYREVASVRRGGVR